MSQMEISLALLISTTHVKVVLLTIDVAETPPLECTILGFDRRETLVWQKENKWLMFDIVKVFAFLSIKGQFKEMLTILMGLCKGQVYTLSTPFMPN